MMLRLSMSSYARGYSSSTSKFLKRPMLLLMRVFEGSGLKVRDLTAKTSVMTFDAEAHCTRLRDVAVAHPIDSIGQLLD